MDAHPGGDGGAVDAALVGALQIFEMQFEVAEHEPRVSAAHEHVVEPDGAPGRSADGGFPVLNLVAGRRRLAVSGGVARPDVLHHEFVERRGRARVRGHCTILSRRRARGASSGPS